MTKQGDRFKRVLLDIDEIEHVFNSGDFDAEYFYRKYDAEVVEDYIKTQAKNGITKEQFFLDKAFLKDLLNYTLDDDFIHSFTVNLDEYFGRRYSTLALADYGKNVDEGWTNAILDADFDRFRNNEEVERIVTQAIKDLDKCIFELYKTSNDGGTTRQYVKGITPKEDPDDDDSVKLTGDLAHLQVY